MAVYHKKWIIFVNQHVIVLCFYLGYYNCDKIKQEIAANCEKYIRAKDTQVSQTIFPSEFKLVKPFILLSFIYESTDRYEVFHMTHSWQLCCCRMRQICYDLMNKN